MKRLGAFAVLLGLVAAAGYWATRASGARAQLDQWTWLQCEFHLSPAQLAREQQLYAAYQPLCLEHCRRLVATRNRLAAVERTVGRHHRDYWDAFRAWEDVKTECNTTTLKHLQAAAAVMNPEDGRRYLATMVPRVALPDRVAPLPVR